MLSLLSPFPKFHLPVASLQYLRQNACTSNVLCRFRSSYIVLLPEIPNDEAESNPLLSESHIPDFKELTAEKCFMGVGKKSLDYEAGVWDIEEKLSDKKGLHTFDSVIAELDKLDESLANVWSIAKTLYCVRNNHFSTSNYLKIHERARKARVCKYQSQSIYEACKKIYVKETDLSEVQRRVLKKFLLEARLNGMELSSADQKILQGILNNLQQLKNKYKRNIKESSKQFQYRIIDKEIADDLPDDLLKKMSLNTSDHTSGPWVLTHHPVIYKTFMETCTHKDLRWNAWNAYVMRSSTHTAKALNNTKIVEEIRSSRESQANILGFKTFADMSMETKMAGSVENVINVITSLFSKAKEKQTEEIRRLKEFAMENGFRNQFEESDLPYWRKKQLESILKFDESKSKGYFTFDYVWDQLLSLSSNLFGIHFEKVAPQSVSTWHPSVRFYNILDREGNQIASFYMDPYRRPNEKLEPQPGVAWMMPLRRRSLTTSHPLASVIFNCNAPGDSREFPSFLTLQDMAVMFKKFGHALQHLLSTVSYGQVSGITNIEWDAVELCSNFMLNWLYDPTVLQKLSKHHETGEQLDAATIQNILEGRNHLAAYDLCQELFISHLDIRLHSENAYWMEILKELWSIYMPFELTKYHSLPCWFSPIMSDVWASAYYSHVWSKMLAADAFQAFKECEPSDLMGVGLRFRETFLSLGGGCHPAEVFRKFRGRDPMPEALHSVLGIS